MNRSKAKVVCMSCTLKYSVQAQAWHENLHKYMSIIAKMISVRN